MYSSFPHTLTTAQTLISRDFSTAANSWCFLRRDALLCVDGMSEELFVGRGWSVVTGIRRRYYLVVISTALRGPGCVMASGFSVIPLAESRLFLLQGFVGRYVLGDLWESRTNAMPECLVAPSLNTPTIDGVQVSGRTELTIVHPWSGFCWSEGAAYHTERSVITRDDDARLVLAG